jgi:uncharacterized membrane protein SirB2
MTFYDFLLFSHFIGLALTLGTSFSMIRLRGAVKEMEPAERVKFLLTAFALNKNGSMGLGLLILTGIGMMAIKGFGPVMAWGGGAFHAKLTLVVILSGLLGYSQVLAKKAKRAQGGPIMAKIPKVGVAMMVIGLAIVLCAVAAFH